MKHSIIRRLALVLALAMLLSAIGLAEELSLNGLELPETDMDGLSMEDVFIGEGDGLELPDFEGEIELPDADGETGEAAEEEAAPEAPEIVEDLDGTVDEAAASIETEPAQNDSILIDEEIEETGGAGDGSWQTHCDIPGARADNDALADAYLRRVLPGFGKGGRTLASPGAGRKMLVQKGLTGTVALYDALKPMIEAIAAGTRTSAEFTFDSTALGTADHWWTPEDVGASGLDDGNLGDLLMAKEGIDTGALVKAFLEDCPYHLYWFDKTRGWSTGCTYADDGSRARLETVSLALTVADAYAAGAYAVNALPAYVSQAVSNINTIINNNASKGDLDKVTAYADVICNYVEYNFPAAEDDNTPYGDPWQLVWIFDGNPDTKVVCEGYAKGFKYLCDLSTFQGSVSCVLAEGTLSGGTGSGPHMWNSLKMPDGRCYLVDLTNCDAGETCSYTLFLKGATGEAGGPYVCAGLSYAFYDWLADSFGGDMSWLTYSSADYGKEESGGDSGDGTVNADWTALQAQINAAANNATVTLSKNITAGGGNIGLEIPAGKSLTLDLAGHTLSRGLKAAKNNGYVLGVSGSLTVKDSVGGGKITGGWTSTYGGGIYVDYGASLTLAGGEISGNQAYDGGGIGAPNGTIVISGGKISGNDAISGGGGVKLDGGKIEMTGGEIKGNQACYGGGIYVLYASFELKDGKITDNDAYSPTFIRHEESGGGIYAYGATVTISGGEISGNRSNLTGGNRNIYHPKEHTIFGTKGGGLFLKYGTLTMSNGKIRDNTSSIGGGLVLEDSDAVMTGGTICNNTGHTGGGVMIHACTDADIAAFTVNGGEISDNSADSHGGGIYVEGTDGNAHFVLEQGTVRENTASFGGGVKSTHGTIQMKSGVIEDNIVSYNGGGIDLFHSTMNLSGGSISGNKTTSDGYGGGLCIYTGSFVMSAGSISNNSADCGGGLVLSSLDDATLFSMSGGEIIGNQTNTLDGGGIYADKGSIVELSGGSISENMACRYGGGIYTGGCTFKLSGSPSIVSNRDTSGDSNCFLIQDTSIALTGTLGKSAQIGVRDAGSWNRKGAYVFTSGLGAGGNISAFFNDDPNYTIEWSVDGKEAMLVKRESPTAEPTAEPTAVPTAQPTAAPTGQPTAAPTGQPTAAPTAKPTAAPTGQPTAAPTGQPTAAPKVDLSRCKLSVMDQTYTGKALKPAVTVNYGSVTLKQGTDYTVSYNNNVKPGKATVTVTGKGNYTGSAKATFAIRVPLSKCKLTVKGQTYTGKALKPAVTVKYGSKKLKKGTDYTVSYKANKAVGVATATVKGKGNYTGTKKVTFKILPRTVAISKLTAGKQSLTVKWAKRAEATGYELQYALKSSFAGAKTVKIKKNTTVSATVKKLKKGKTYYVRLRSYKTAGKKTYTSAWSAAKKAKVK